MAARRLIILMLVLLVASSVAAALAPRIEPTGEESTTTTDPPNPEPAPDEAQGRLLERSVDADPERARTVRVRVGDRLALLVRSPRVAQIAIPSLGLLETAAPLDPARFDLFLERPGRHAVRLLEPQRTVAEIVVAPQPEGAGAPPP